MMWVPNHVMFSKKILKSLPILIQEIFVSHWKHLNGFVPHYTRYMIKVIWVERSPRDTQ